MLSVDEKGDLKCPADSNQGNGMQVYSKFLHRIKELQELQCLPILIASNFHDGNLDGFCADENHTYLPSLSEHGKLHRFTILF